MGLTHIDAALHVRGQSEYVDDVRPPADMLHAVVYGSPVAHGRLVRLDLESACAAEGVAGLFVQADIPGNPRIGPILQDEFLLAAEEVAYVGQPIALVVATTRERAVQSRRLIRAEFEPLPVTVDPRVAYDQGDLIVPPRTISMGDVDRAWPRLAHVIEGRCDTGGQEHVPLETNRARAIPREDGQLTVWSSTQSPYAGQKAIARILGVPQHKVEVDVKPDRGRVWRQGGPGDPLGLHGGARGPASHRPVELVLSRKEDMRMTGKRHPYSSDFKMGLDAEGRILAYEAHHYQNSGAFADLSIPVLERTLLHSTGGYYVPNVRVTAACCRTHLPPNTAFRGFGGPQGMFVIEAGPGPGGRGHRYTPRAAAGP